MSGTTLPSEPHLVKRLGDSWDRNSLWGLDANRVVWAFMAIGIFARLVRFAVCQPLWPDEAFLAASYLDRGYGDFLDRPLEYHQVAPLLYLWVQLTLVKLLGFSEWSLRCFPLVCSIGSLLLFRHLAARLLHGLAYIWAVSIFSVAYPLIRYAAEAKPYGSDVFVALVLITLAVRIWQAEPPQRWLLALIAMTPFAVFLSYPSVFVAGACWIAIAFEFRGNRRPGRWLLLVYGFVLVASFVGSYLVSMGVQSDNESIHMTKMWEHTFPPTSSIGALLGWLIEKHSSEALSYPIGAARGGSLLTLIWVVAGLVIVARKRNWPLASLCIGTAGLNLIAAGLHKYPYGGHVRFALFAAPLICLLAGLGAARLHTVAMMNPRWQRRLLPVWLGLFILIAGGSVVRDVIKPYKTPEFARSRSLARWFWHDYASNAELVCLYSDLGLDFAPPTFEWGKSSLYLCNQKIYSRRHHFEQSPRWDLISHERPLRCVLYRYTACRLIRRNSICGSATWKASTNWSPNTKFPNRSAIPKKMSCGDFTILRSWSSYRACRVIRLRPQWPAATTALANNADLRTLLRMASWNAYWQ